MWWMEGDKGEVDRIESFTSIGFQTSEISEDSSRFPYSRKLDNVNISLH